MKLKNKITGEVKEFALFDGNELQGGATLERLTKEWEDYEDPKKIVYWIDTTNGIVQDDDEVNFHNTTDDYWNRDIGNYFETKEEAEKAVEKLKAWKRLKDKGFHWLWYNSTPEGNSVDFYISDWDKEATRDIDLLFGGEE